MIGELIKTDREKTKGVRIYRRSLFRRRWFQRLALLVFIVGVAGLLLMVVFLKPYKDKADTFALEDLHNLDRTSIIYDRSGNELGSLSLENRRPVTLDDIPYEVIQALTAQEDSRFFEHSGVDFIGIVRAVWLNLKAGNINQGASTLTQQLARNSYREEIGFSKTLERKLAEAFLAARIERHYSKAEILELYLNRIYFGSGFWGINSASIGYFGKHVSELDIPEAATLCGIIKAPNTLSPMRNPVGSRDARNQVLNRMRIEKMISEEEFEQYRNSMLVTAPTDSDNKNSYAFAAISQEVVEKIGAERASTGGFRVYTTIDPKIQKEAESSLQKHFSNLEQRPDYNHQTIAQFKEAYRRFKEAGGQDNDPKRPKPEYLQGSVIMIDNKNGDILAMVGGREFKDSNFNRAILAERAAGTAFTPFVFGAAFEKDHYPSSRLKDDPLDNRWVMIGGLEGILGEWGAEQQRPIFEGWMSAREALANGKNSATVRLGLEIGDEKTDGIAAVNEFAKRAGIRSKLSEYPNTFLGSSNVRLTEMCLAYSAIANGGTRPEGMNLVHRILDSEGKEVFSKKSRDQQVEVTDPVTAFQLHSCLHQALYEGTGSKCRDYGILTQHAAGKTGTHYHFKDLWFVGYDDKVTCAVWAGFDLPRTILPGAFSNDVCLPVWTDVMNASLEIGAFKAEEITPPDSAEAVNICQFSGLRATDACYEVREDPRTGLNIWAATVFQEHVRPGYDVNSYCDFHIDSGTDYQALQALNRTTNIHEIASNVEAVRSAETVRIQSPTVSGQDPWNSTKPKISDVDLSDAHSMPLGVEDLFPADLEKATLPVKLTPPPALDIE
jgi:membrane peptidoglycan carboxypeptidase